jgi:hypothetical protein
MHHTDADARLQLLLTAVQSRWGAGAVQPLARLQPGLRTGFPDLDARLAPAGIPTGGVTLLLSVPTSGMMTLVYRTLALAQGGEASVLYIDQEGTFDAPYAASMGIHLERLFLIRPETPLEALDLARDLLQAEPIGALVLDAGHRLPSSTALRRLNGALTRRGPALLVLNWLPPARSLAHLSQLPARLKLLVERLGWLRQGEDIIGCRVRVQRLNPGQAEPLATFNIRFDGRGEREP